MPYTKLILLPPQNQSDQSPFVPICLQFPSQPDLMHLVSPLNTKIQHEHCKTQTWARMKTKRNLTKTLFILLGALLLLPWHLALGAPAGISQNAMDEIGALLQEKASWTPTQRKLESQLIHAL